MIKVDAPQKHRQYRIAGLQGRSLLQSRHGFVQPRGLRQRQGLVQIDASGARAQGERLRKSLAGLVETLLGSEPLSTPEEPLGSEDMSDHTGASMASLAC